MLFRSRAPRGDRGDRGERRERGDRGEGRGRRGDREPKPEPTGPEPEVGKVYRGKVVSTKDFGAFVEYLPGREGLCHVSELASFRVKRTEDIARVGDEILVKYLGLDEKGRVRLSRKAAMEDREKEAGAAAGGDTAAPAPAAPPADEAK